MGGSTCHTNSSPNGIVAKLERQARPGRRPGLLAPAVGFYSSARDAEQQQLAALALERERSDLLHVHQDRVRLDVEQERAWAERIRRVHDAARLPRSLPRGRVTCLVDLRRDAQCPAGEVVAPDTGRRPRGVRGGVLVLAPGVLLEEDAGAGGLDVVRIVDERPVARARRTERVALDEDRQAEDVR